MAKKSSPQDATRRNVQAANKRFSALKADVAMLKRDVKALTGQLTAVWRVLERVTVPKRGR